MARLSEDSVVAARPEVASCTLDGEAVLLDVAAGRYHGLNEVGTRVWELLREPRRVSALRERLLAEYEVGAERLTADLLALLAELLRAGLIEVREG